MVWDNKRGAVRLDKLAFSSQRSAFSFEIKEVSIRLTSVVAFCNSPEPFICREPLRVPIVHETTPAEAMGMRAVSSEELAAVRHALAEEAFESAQEVIEHFADLNLERVLKLGDPTTEILHFAKECGVDLIAIGSRRLSTFQQLMLGSVSSKVARHAPCTVTIVR